MSITQQLARMNLSVPSVPNSLGAYTNTGVIVCLNVNTQIEFGVDLNAFSTVPPRFMGAKLIPPYGVHFVYWSSGEIRAGTFLRFHSGLSAPHVVIMKWDISNEDFLFSMAIFCLYCRHVILLQIKIATRIRNREYMLL